METNRMTPHQQREHRSGSTSKLRRSSSDQRRRAAMEDDDILARLDPAENEIVRLSSEERAVFEEAVAPVVARQRERLGGSLFDLLT